MLARGTSGQPESWACGRGHESKRGIENDIFKRV